MHLKPLTCLVGHLFLCEAGLVNIQRKYVRVGGWIKKKLGRMNGKGDLIDSLYMKAEGRGVGAKTGPWVWTRRGSCKDPCLGYVLPQS